MKKAVVCTQCYHVGQPKNYTKGHIVLEIGLWLLLLPIGIIYSIWRLTSKYTGCECCGATSIIPHDSKAAQKFIEKINID